jgi:hypothetical protein
LQNKSTKQFRPAIEIVRGADFLLRRIRLIKAHSSAREWLPENVDKNTFLPFHPGAVRYYREIGIKIPDELALMN